MDYLDKDHTITGAYYAYLLRQLQENIKQIRRGKLTRGVLFHQDNAPADTSAVAMATISEDPPYSPELPRSSVVIILQRW